MYVVQVLAIRTSTLEEKATACNMIVCYLDELKEGFFPYVQEVRAGCVRGGGGGGGREAVGAGMCALCTCS